jgi:hypothetical protein
MPSPLERHNFNDELKAWHRVNGHERGAQADFEAYLEDSYARAADHNYFVNQAKSEFLFRANAATIYCALLLALAFIPFALYEMSKPEQTYTIDVRQVPYSLTHWITRHDRAEEARAAASSASKAGGTTAKGPPRGPNH